MSDPVPPTAEAGTILLVDKPRGWTSFMVVRKVRYLLSGVKAGHGGTLDPLATGLLVLATGPRTRDLMQITGYDKEDTGTLELGRRTTTFDLEGTVVSEQPVPTLTNEEVHAAFSAFVGEIEQMPPMFSAAKVRGKPLYRYARKGRVVERKPRGVIVSEFAPTAVRLPEIEFRVRCSKGTYIRTLVDDLGSRLGCGAVLTVLRRTQVGPFHVSDAFTIEELEQRLAPASAAAVEAAS